MSATVAFQENIARILLAGALDFSTQGEIDAAREQVFAAVGVSEIQVDFKDVSFVDSSVIRALLYIRKKAIAAGINLLLINFHEPIQEIFIVGGFDKIFTIQ
jgi:anti-anti-sigma factor